MSDVSCRIDHVSFFTCGAMKPNPRAVPQPVSSQTVAELPREQEIKTSAQDIASSDLYILPTGTGVRSHPKLKMGDTGNSPDYLLVHGFLTHMTCLKLICFYFKLHLFVYLCVQSCATAQVWKPEENFQRLVLIYHMGS